MEGGGDRWPLIRECIASQAPDICVLCEMNGWKSGQTPVAGYNLLVHEKSPSGCSVAIAAREPATLIKSVQEPLRHGALVVRAGGLSIAALHLSPDGEQQRVAEAEWVIAELADIAGPLILAGDLNSLNPVKDPDNPRTWVIPRFKEAGFADPFELIAHDWTLCTGLKPEEPRWRFDYIMPRNCGDVLECGVLHDPEFANASDHWPITLTI